MKAKAPAAIPVCSGAMNLYGTGSYPPAWNG